MTGEFTDKEKLLICGLEAIGLFCGSQELLGAGHRNNTVYTVEDLIKLYDTAGKKRVFKSSGELADWAWKVLNGPLLADLYAVQAKMPGGFLFQTDRIEFGIEEILKIGL